VSAAKRERTPERRERDAARKRAARAGRPEAAPKRPLVPCPTCLVLAQVVDRLTSKTDGDAGPNGGPMSDAKADVSDVRQASENVRQASVNAVHNRARISRSDSHSQSFQENTREEESESLRARADAADASETSAFASDNVRPTSVRPQTSERPARHGGGERYVAVDDALTQELADLVTTNTTVQDVRSAWVKFCGVYAGQWVHVAGKWQAWCVSWAKNERIERDKAAAAARESGTRIRPAGIVKPQPVPDEEVKRLMREAGGDE
jgi:hypothetical protein